MNGRQIRTLEAVFADPISRTIAWSDLEGLLLAAGAVLVEGSGSRVKFRKGTLVAAFHRPHPAKEAKPYQVRDAREFLVKIGVMP